MNNKYYSNLILFFLILLLYPSLLFADSFKISDPSINSPFEDLITSDNNLDKFYPGWEYVNNIQGINSFQKNMPNTQSKAYKGVCLINCPIKTIYSIISDVNNHSKWVKFCNSSQAIGKQSPTKSTQYYQFDIPWPFSNRDMVINSTADINWDSGKVTISSVATSQSEIPQTENFIRVIESNQRWTLERITPTSTKVTFTSYTPLNISDSTLIKNIASVTIPFSTLEQLKILSAKKYAAYSSQCIVKSESASKTDIEKDFKLGSYN